MRGDQDVPSTIEILTRVLLEEFGAALTLEEAQQRAASIRDLLARRGVLLMTATEVEWMEEQALRHEDE